MTVDLHCGDSLEVMRQMEANSIETILTDPPYGLSFMGKDWDHGIPGVPFWEAALRVAKPGAMLLAFGGTRTFHRLTVAIEDAGWEIRDCLMWLYGSGFPKSHDVSKAIDRMAGAEREVIGIRTSAFGTDTATGERVSRANGAGGAGLWGGSEAKEVPLTGTPATEAAALWDGWGTALKPAWEPIILAMKPVEKGFASNALAHGVAGLAIDRARVVTNDNLNGGGYSQGESKGMWTPNGRGGGLKRLPGEYVQPAGRWPANLILQCLCDRDDGTHDNPECPCAILDAQSGERKGDSPDRKPRIDYGGDNRNTFNKGWNGSVNPTVHADQGGASRFFAQVKPDASRLIYSAKASRRERNAGLEGMPERDGKVSRFQNDREGAVKYRIENGEITGPKALPVMSANHHPTVKPLSLCRYLARLTSTPTGGTVLDPFCGSGSIGCAAVMEGRSFVGIDISEEYLEIAKRRIEYWQSQAEAQTNTAQPMLLAAD